MINLPNGCWRSKISVHPSDWDQPGAFIADEWYLQYRFHDPNFFRSYPEGKLCIVKKGINSAATLRGRRERVKRRLAELEEKLSGGYNPITKITIPPVDDTDCPQGVAPTVDNPQPVLPAAAPRTQPSVVPVPVRAPANLVIDETSIKASHLVALEIQSHYIAKDCSLLHPDVIDIIEPQAPFIHALWQAYKKLAGVPNYLTDVRCCIRGITQAAYMLHYLDMPICNIDIRHINLCLEACSKFNPRWSNHRHNKYRSYLMALYVKLRSQQAVYANIINDIEEQKEVKPKRQVVTPEEREIIHRHLRVRSYTFWRFVQIFFASGARETELMRLQVKDVNLPKREYLAWIFKGDTFRQEPRVISPITFWLWQQLMFEAIELSKKYRMQDSVESFYLFSKFLRPGLKSIRPDQIGRRWDKYVKKELGINADIYTLKHAYTDELAEKEGIKAAQRQNSHTSERTALIYAQGEAQRELNRLKKVAIPFVPPKAPSPGEEG